jgi:3-oxoacyl-[acyl-carrier protein] reductase
VNSIQPGSHDTDRVKKLGLDTSGIPAGVLGRPEDFGVIAAFLCSEHVRFLTGSAIHVDGGAYAGLL